MIYISVSTLMRDIDIAILSDFFLSVRPSRSGILWKRLNISSQFNHSSSMNIKPLPEISKFSVLYQISSKSDDLYFRQHTDAILI